MYNLKNLSIRNKLILSLVAIFLTSAGLGIVMYNNILDYSRALKSSLFFNKYYIAMSQIQNYYNNLQIVVLNITNIKTKEELIKYSNEYRNLNIQINKQFENIKTITELEENTKFIDNIIEFNDTLHTVIITYNQSISPTLSKIEEIKLLLIQPQNIYQNYKTLVQEQISANQLTQFDILNKNQQQIINELIYIYQNTLSDNKNFLLKTLNYEIQKIDRIKNSHIITQFNPEKFDLIVERSQRIFIILFILFTLLTVFIIIYITTNIVKPLLDINSYIAKLANGETVSSINIDRFDEIGLLENSLNSLNQYLNENIEFAKNLAQNNFDAKLKAKNVDDVLRNSLITLRDSLINSKKEEQKRSIEDYRRQRTADAISKFADILRTYQNDIVVLSRELISNLVKFLNANQGMFFIINEQGDEKYLKLYATYAWDREKFIDKRIDIGEGLIGSVVVDKFTVYMTNVPEDYIEIKSGTGSANPKTILITPLKVEDEVLGIIEIASFNEFEPYEIKLVETICENIASTIKSVKISQKTSELLENFQIQAFEMKEQEEALKNKINDLKNIENEFKLKEQEYIEKIKVLEDNQKQMNFKFIQTKKQIDDLNQTLTNLNARIEREKNNFKNIFSSTDDGVLVIDSNNSIEYVNDIFVKLSGFSEMEIISSDFNNYFKFDKEITFDTIISTIKENKNYNIDNVKIIGKNNKTSDVAVFFSYIWEDDRQKVVIYIRDKAKYQLKEEKQDEFFDRLLKISFENSIKIDFYEKYFVNNNIPLPEIESSKNEILTWSSYLELGINLIDKQHQKWIQLINDLYIAIVNKSNNDVLLDIFKRLFEYTEYHFGFEEKYMKEFSFPFYDTHHMNHEKFVSDMNNMFSDYISSPKKDLPYKLLFYLKEWVFSHIVYTDKKYVDTFKQHGLK